MYHYRTFYYTSNTSLIRTYAQGGPNNLVSFASVLREAFTSQLKLLLK